MRSTNEKQIEFSQRWQAEDTIRWFRKRADIPGISGPSFMLDIMSFHKPRLLDIYENGVFRRQITILPHWSSFEVHITSTSPCRISLEAPGECEIPFELGQSRDIRCLSFCLRNTSDVAVNNTSESFTEYYALTSDPSERTNLLDKPVGAAVPSHLIRELDLYHRDTGQLYRKLVLKPTDEMQEQLRLLGYIE